MQNGSAPGQPSPSQRFVPSGVDAQSWMGFEQRIQERRYNALLETMRVAIAVGDPVGAHAALAEARELRPDAAELDAYDLRIRTIPVASGSPGRLPVGRWRAFSAVAMLLGGVGFLTGTDYLRSQPARPAATAAISFGAPPPAAEHLSPLARDASGLTVLRDRGLTTTPRTPSFAEVPLATTGSGPDEGAELTVPTSLRPVVLEQIPPPPGETPNDFVYPAPTVPSALDADALPPRSSTAPPSAATPNAVALRLSPAASQPVGSPVPSPTLASPVAAASSPSRAGAAPAMPGIDEGRVTATLNAYARAYERLDAGAARAVWPTVNERALARAFASLESQRVSFDRCQIELNGTTANASCRGQASYVGKVGSREPRTESREWRFQLRRDGDEWRIANAEARRP